MPVAEGGVSILTPEEEDKRRDGPGSGTHSSNHLLQLHRLLIFGKPAKSEICFQLMALFLGVPDALTLLLV